VETLYSWLLLCTKVPLDHVIKFFTQHVVYFLTLNDLLHKIHVWGCRTFARSQRVLLSHFISIQLFVTLWTIACQAPLPEGFSRQEYWSGLPFPSPEDSPSPGIKSASLASPALAGRFFTTSTTLYYVCLYQILCFINIDLIIFF